MLQQFKISLHAGRPTQPIQLLVLWLLRSHDIKNVHQDFKMLQQFKISLHAGRPTQPIQLLVLWLLPVRSNQMWHIRT